MKIQKEIKDIKFTECDVYGTKMPVSENIIMSSAAGWYVGSVCKDPDCGGFIVPFDRYTGYYATPEDVAKHSSGATANVLVEVGNHFPPLGESRPRYP